MHQLTPRLVQVARLLVAGKRYPEIGTELNLAPGTIKKHAEEIFRRLNVNGVVDLTREYLLQLSERRIGALAGYWLSRFEYQSRTLSAQSDRYVLGVQINLEYIDEVNEDYFTHKGVSLCSSPSTKLTFAHQLYFKRENQVFSGIWQNTNTNNTGCMQLVIRSDNQGMHGLHLGTTSDLAVSSGGWIWRKVFAPAGDMVQPDTSNFRTFGELEKFFSPTADIREPIQMRDLFRKSK